MQDKNTNKTSLYNKDYLIKAKPLKGSKAAKAANTLKLTTQNLKHLQAIKTDCLDESCLILHCRGFLLYNKRNVVFLLYKNAFINNLKVSVLKTGLCIAASL